MVGSCSRFEKNDEHIYNYQKLLVEEKFEREVDSMPEIKNELLAKLPQEKIEMLEKAFMQLAPSKEEAWNPDSMENVKGALEIIQTKTPRYITLIASLIDLIDIPSQTANEKKDTTTLLYKAYFDEDYLKKQLYDGLAPYLDFLKKNSSETYQKACDFIRLCITNRYGIKENLESITINKGRQGSNIRTHYPNQFISPVDKVSNIAFNYAEVKNLILYKGNPVSILVGKHGSKKEITTTVSINFDEMEKQGVEIYGSKELTMYDREVHDAIATLCVEGENQWITPQMIYQVMTGDPDARFRSKQSKQLEAISNSVTKMMRSEITIDASKEAEAFGFDSFQYSGSLIPAEKVVAKLNGTVVECIHLHRNPPLYDYADRKGQIGRADIKLLNSPLNKTEETSILQGYLLRRILAIKNPHNKQSNSILYETIYRQLDVTAPNDGALRKKKIDIRKKVKEILDYWKTVNFIKEYEEIAKGQTIYSITITVEKTPRNLGGTFGNA